MPEQTEPVLPFEVTMQETVRTTFLVHLTQTQADDIDYDDMLAEIKKQDARQIKQESPPEDACVARVDPHASYWYWRWNGEEIRIPLPPDCDESMVAVLLAHLAIKRDALPKSNQMVHFTAQTTDGRRSVCVGVWRDDSLSGYSWARPSDA